VYAVGLMIRMFGKTNLVLPCIQKLRHRSAQLRLSAAFVAEPQAGEIEGLE
jgi:hypothetical protein